MSSNFVSATFDGDFEQGLAKLEKDVSDKVIFAGAAATAKVIYDQARENAPVSERAHFFYGTQFRKTGQRYFFKSGTLKESIYRVYAPEQSIGTQKVYKIAWNHRKCPYGFMVEYGTSRAPAHPFLRPALGAIPFAIEVGKTVMEQRFGSLT